MGGARELLHAFPKISRDFFSKALPFLNKQSDTAVGLEWNDSDVRVVEVRKGSPQPEITHAFAGSFEDPPEMAIPKALALANISTTSVRISIAGEGIIVRYILLPRMKKEEIAAALSFEWEKYIPYKQSEVFFDYQVLGETKEGKLRVLIVAARHGLIQKVIDSFKRIQLQPSLIDVTGFALSNIFFFNRIHTDSDEARGLVHIGKELTTVTVVRGETIYFSRDISIGESQIQSDFVLLVDLANEVRYSFDYYESQWSDSVKRVYLSGQVAPSLLEPLQKAMDLEVSFWDPTGGFKIAESISQDEFNQIKPHLHLALGLAIRDL